TANQNPPMELVSVDDNTPASPCDGAGCRTFDPDEESGGRVVNEDGSVVVFQGRPSSNFFVDDSSCSFGSNKQVFVRVREPNGGRDTILASVTGANHTCGNNDSRRPSVSTILTSTTLIVF